MRCRAPWWERWAFLLPLAFIAGTALVGLWVLATIVRNFVELGR